MPTYVGFSTVDVNQPRQFLRTGADGGVGSLTQKPRVGKKFRLTDNELVARDLENAFSIKQGEKVGNPNYGTTLWSFVFEPNTSETRIQIENEVRRVAGLDPRLSINTLEVYEHADGVLLELEINVSPYNNLVQLGFFFNRQSGTVSAVSV